MKSPPLDDSSAFCSFVFIGLKISCFSRQAGRKSDRQAGQQADGRLRRATANIVWTGYITLCNKRSQIEQVAT